MEVMEITHGAPQRIPCFVAFLEHISLHITISHDKALLTSKHTLLQDARLTLTLTLVLHTRYRSQVMYMQHTPLDAQSQDVQLCQRHFLHQINTTRDIASKPQYVLTPTLPLGSESREWSDRTRSPVSNYCCCDCVTG